MNDMTDKELVFWACNYWANYIETGVMTLSATDAQNQQRNSLIKALNVDQMKLIIRLRELGDRA